MNTRIEDLVKVSPATWPGKQLQVQRGDLALTAPMGSGIQGPFPIGPWDNPLSADYHNPGEYYSFHAHVNHPFLNAPITEAAGGTVYFDGQPDEPDIQALLGLLEVGSMEKHYAVFVAHATNPEEERYLTQLRIVSRFALNYMYHALSREEYDAFPSQNLNVGELIWGFIRQQQEAWGTYDSPELSGVMGGDGDWAKESLAFGFTVENRYHGVHRIWSRAWLVTK